jgi:hypothetical protein
VSHTAEHDPRATSLLRASFEVAGDWFTVGRRFVHSLVGLEPDMLIE